MALVAFLRIKVFVDLKWETVLGLWLVRNFLAIFETITKMSENVLNKPFFKSIVCKTELPKRKTSCVAQMFSIICSLRCKSDRLFRLDIRIFELTYDYKL